MKFENEMDLSQNLKIMERLALFSGDMYPLEPISKGARFTFCDVISQLRSNVNIFSIKSIQTISIHDIGSYQYPFKYTERTWLNNIVRTAGTDEVILTHKGFIKDASYANLVFFDGKTWITPSQPLLMGTRRASLINAKTIIESPIQVKELEKFSFVKCINAMMLWEESPKIKIEHSLFKSF